MKSPVTITAFYKFHPTAEADVPAVQKRLTEYGKEHAMGGLVILATEGVNGTVSGSPEAIGAWKKEVESIFGEVTFKDSEADHNPFKRWFVKVRPEIVSLKKPDIVPEGLFNHISPQEWNEMMENDDVVIIDTRNDYETEIGMFQGAIDPKLKSFHEFPDYVAKCNIPKDKKIMMYCTGGIRCEKASLEMARQGYQHVYQLNGGILEYLKQFPNQKFEGECFVFDHRTAVKQDLKPSEQYALCPHCGDPGDRRITCEYCQKNVQICAQCKGQPLKRRACSKNCSHHLERVGVA